MQKITKVDTQTVNRHIKRCSISLSIREIQIKTTVRYHYTSIKMESRSLLCIILKLALLMQNQAAFSLPGIWRWLDT